MAPIVPACNPKLLRPCYGMQDQFKDTDHATKTENYNLFLFEK